MQRVLGGAWPGARVWRRRFSESTRAGAAPCARGRDGDDLESVGDEHIMINTTHKHQGVRGTEWATLCELFFSARLQNEINTDLVVRAAKGARK